MLNSVKEWNISFAGCGFLSVYYLGVYSCLLERAHDLIDRTTKICGASSGALIGAMVACQKSPATCCENLMDLAKEARKCTLSALHPSFNLLQRTRELLTRELPSNAHLLASGRLYVSLTRVSDGENVLVSEFGSRDDLIQALVCSCFFPFYCGLIPLRYRGTYFVDGALSNNLPFCGLKNTITISPFSGESDICPHENSFYFHEVQHSNVCIQVNFANVHRVIQAFFPPETEVMAEICQNGYKDALDFLRKNDFLETDRPMIDIAPQKQDRLSSSNPYEAHNRSGVDAQQDSHSIFRHCGSMRGQNCLVDKHEPDLLPEPIQKVFCEAGVKKQGGFGDLLVVKMLISTLSVCALPVEIIYFTLLRFGGWMSEMLLWLWDVTVQIVQYH